MNMQRKGKRDRNRKEMDAGQQKTRKRKSDGERKGKRDRNRKEEDAGKQKTRKK